LAGCGGGVRNPPHGRIALLRSAHSRGWASRLFPLYDRPLPIMLEFAWANAAPGREAAAQDEVLRAFGLSAFGQTGH